MKKVENQSLLSFILGVFKEKKVTKAFFISLIIALIAYTFFYGIWRIPFLDFGLMRMSPVTLSDYLFIGFTSLVVALLVAFIRYEIIHSIKTGKALSRIGVGVAGFASAVCPVCQGVTLIALGSTIGNIPLGPLVPYLGLIKLVSVGLLLLALTLKVDSTYRKTCITCKIIPTNKTIRSKKPVKSESILFRSNVALVGLIVIVVMLMLNSILIPKAFQTTLLGSGGVLNLGKFQYGSKTTLKPMPLAHGEQPSIASYKTIVKSLPTISEIQTFSSTGDAAKDLLNNLIPKGTPWYGAETGVSFDDPIGAQKLWQKGLAIQLSGDEEKRWERITNSFTCDYCCGSPQQPTIITRCGCSHSRAAQGMAKWFVKNHGSQYSDEEIYGEMARWYALWYPGPTIKRILQEAQN